MQGTTHIKEEIERIRLQMEEAKRQNLRNPMFAIEYERTEGEELVLNVSKSIEYFKKTAAELAAPGR